MLKIQGPVHFDNVDKKGNLIKNPKGWSNPNTRGVYVWGFMYIYENGKFIKPIDFLDKEVLEVLDLYYSNKCELPENWKFLPYYVGKKEGSIFSRIKTHQKVRQGDARKYIRLSFDYLREFFKDPLYPVKYNRKPNLPAVLEKHQQDPNSIEYFNSDKFLNLKYPNCILTPSGRNSTDYPITDQNDCNGNPLPDTLDKIVNQKNNFWFCYLPIDEDKSLTKYETFVFYSLKGKTTIQTQRFSSVIKSIVIKNDTDTDIFNVDENNNLVATDTFSGY